MNATSLDNKPVGDILLIIVQEWRKTDGKVTVEQFCEVSVDVLKLKIVEQELHEAEKKFTNSKFHDELSDPRPGDSTEELV